MFNYLTISIELFLRNNFLFIYKAFLLKKKRKRYEKLGNVWMISISVFYHKTMNAAWNWQITAISHWWVFIILLYTKLVEEPNAWVCVRIVSLSVEYHWRRGYSDTSDLMPEMNKIWIKNKYFELIEKLASTVCVSLDALLLYFYIYYCISCYTSIISIWILRMPCNS